MRLDERVESFDDERGVEFGEDTAHEPEVHSADDVLMLLGHLTERAVAQQDPGLRPSVTGSGAKPTSSRTSVSCCIAASLSARR